MSLRNFLTSKVFFKQILIAIVIFALLIFLLLKWIGFFTNHGEEIKVPNLSKLTEEQVEEKLSDLNLDYVLLDTTDYDPDFPKYSVVKQDPLPGFKVKEGRKIYINLNSGSFKAVKIPNLIEQTLREALPALKSLGLQTGEITYRPYIGKDMVIELSQNGRILKPGDKVLQSSKIDIVVGDGNQELQIEESDSTAVDTLK